MAGSVTHGFPLPNRTLIARRMRSSTEPGQDFHGQSIWTGYCSPWTSRDARLLAGGGHARRGEHQQDCPNSRKTSWLSLSSWKPRASPSCRLKESIDTSTPQGTFIMTVFAALAQLERESIHQRQREGIAAARARGRAMGRPAAQYPAEWNQVYAEWQSGAITAAAAIRQLGIRKTTFYKLAKRHQAQQERVAS